MTSRAVALDSWHADWSGLRVAVVGLGASGFAAADTLIELGAEVLVFSATHDVQRAQLLDVIGARLADSAAGPEELGDFAPELLIASPGVEPQHPLIRWATAASIPVWGDVELAWRLRDKVGKVADWIMITGTSGAASTGALVEAMMLASGLRVLACGNGHVPVLDAIRDPVGWDAIVVSLSGPQLHYTSSLSAWASAVVSTKGDHAGWHKSPEDFRQAAAVVYENTRIACVYDRADAEALEMVQNADVIEGARAIGVGLDVPGPSDLGLVDEIVCDRAFGPDRHHTALEITTLQQLETAGLGGPVSAARVLTAMALARSYGVEIASIREALAAWGASALP